MANVDKAEAGKYFSPHDARIGGVLCAICENTLEWISVPMPGDLVLEARHCNKIYRLKDSLFYKLEIENSSNESP